MREVIHKFKTVFLLLMGPLLCVGMVADWQNPDLAQWWDGFNHISSALISFTLATAVSWGFGLWSRRPARAGCRPGLG